MSNVLKKIRNTKNLIFKLTWSLLKVIVYMWLYTEEIYLKTVEY